MTANYKHSCSNRENLALPIQIQLPEKRKVFQFFIAFLESTLNFEHFEKNGPYSSGISEVIVSERRAHLHKSLVSENPLAVNVLKLEIK